MSFKALTRNRAKFSVIGFVPIDVVGLTNDVWVEC